MLCVNLIINYFILLGVARFLRITVKRRRLLLGAALGAVYSLYILLPEWNFLLSLLIKLLMSLTIILSCFGYHGIKRFIKVTACFYFVSFSFAGIMFGLWYIAAPPGLFMNNGIVYFDISPVALIAGTLICYVLIRLFQRLTGREQPKELYCDLKIEMEGKSSLIKAKVDTGNSLVEPFSHLPVVVVEYVCIECLLPAEARDFFKTSDCDYTAAEAAGKENLRYKCRLVPFRAVSGDGVLPAFCPDKVTVCVSNRTCEKNAYVAVYSSGVLGGEFHALVNPELLS